MNKTLDEIIIYDGKIITVKKETVLLPNGQKALREFVHHKNAVAVLPIVNDKIVLVKQYRTGSKDFMIEIPAGLIEDGEDPVNTAIRELQEEVGYIPNTLNFLGKYFLSPGYCDEVIYLYYTDDVKPNKLPLDEDEFIEVLNIPLSEIDDFISSNMLNNYMDAKTILALSLYKNIKDKN